MGAHLGQTQSEHMPHCFGRLRRHVLKVILETVLLLETRASEMDVKFDLGRRLNAF